MKRKVVLFLWGCAGVLFLAGGIYFLKWLVEPRSSYSKNKEFTGHEQDYDVLFFGNSHMANAVFPMELWQEYGITSYNLAGFGSPVPVTYWIMKDTLDKARPDLVVIDCYSVGHEGKIGRTEMLHAQLDGLTLSPQKIRMVSDLLEPENRLEFIWDFAVYHDRWWDLDQADFEPGISVGKGAQTAVGVVAPVPMAEKPMEVVTPDTEGTAYLRRMIEECKSRDIEMLLTYLPFPATEKDWQEALYMEQLAQEYGISCINFLDMQVINLEVDCSDADSHLNGSGGRKVTAYIGQYIKENYDIADHRGEEAYGKWDTDYQQYTDDKLSSMRNLETLDKYLMMCADPAFDYRLYINGSAHIWEQNEMFLPLVENLAGGKADRLEEAAKLGRDYFLTVDNEEKRCQESFEDGDLFEKPEGESAAIQITVINRQDGSILQEKRFDNKLSVYTDDTE